jgi:hypothetical protein
MIRRYSFLNLGWVALFFSCDKDSRNPPIDNAPKDFYVFWSKAVDSNHYPHDGMPLQLGPGYIAYYADQESESGLVKFRNPETGAITGIWNDFLPGPFYKGYDMKSAQTANGDLILSDNDNSAVYRIAPPHDAVGPATVWSYFFPQGFVRDPFALDEDELFFAVNYVINGSRHRSALLRSPAASPSFDTVLVQEAAPGWEVSLVNPLVCRNSLGERLLVSKKSETATAQFRLGLVAFNLDRNRLEWEIDSLESGTAGFGGVVSPLAADGDTLFALGQDKVFAFDVNSGTRLWTYQSTFSSIHYTQGSMVVWADKVYVKSFGPQLICLKKSDGKQRWIATVGETHGQPIVEYGNYIYHCRDGMHAVHKNSGSVTYWIPPQGWRSFYQNPVFDRSNGKMYLASATLVHCIQSLP